MEPCYSRPVNKRKDKCECFTWEALAPRVRLLLKFPRWSLKQEKAENILFCNPSFLIQKDNTGLRKPSLKKEELIPVTFR